MRKMPYSAGVVCLGVSGGAVGVRAGSRGRRTQREAWLRRDEDENEDEDGCCLAGVDRTAWTLVGLKGCRASGGRFLANSPQGQAA